MLRHYFLVSLQGVLIDLIVEYTSVRILQFCLVQHLCLVLLLGLYLALPVFHLFLSFHNLLLFLSRHREGVHMLRVDLILLIDCRLLVLEVPLLVCIEWIVCYFRVDWLVSADAPS